MIERILEDLYMSDNSFKIAILRYFNPVGAHESGMIQMEYQMPFISQVAVGKREYLNVFGNDYDTHDGTGVRDYIHVVDLAYGHVKAIDYLNNSNNIKVNLGTGIGYSVLDVLKAYEKVSNTKIPYKIVDRRAGDIANPKFAKDVLGWEAKKNLDDMCQDSYKWQKMNPKIINF